jgi:hypothetical protein
LDVKTDDPRRNLSVRSGLVRPAAILIAVGFLFLPGPSRRACAQPAPPADSVFQPGEELTYNVSYGSFDIGRVRISLVETLTSGGRVTSHAVANIDSYRGIPLVDLHSIYATMIDQEMFSTWFNARTREDERWREWTYRFEYARSSVFIEEGFWKQGTIVRRDTLRLDTLSQDGLSLFFLARKYLLSHQRVTVPTIVREKKGRTVIDFDGARTKEEIEAVPYPVDVLHFEGEAKFVGVFGLTGGFEGWFSNDAARVPVLAKMKVLIGNIRIELVSWKRTGWTPPRYPSEGGK